MRGAAAAAAAVAAAGAFSPSEEEEAAAATPPPASSPNAAFPAPPPAFAMAPALEAIAAAETAKALKEFWEKGRKTDEEVGVELKKPDRRKKDKTFCSLSSLSLFLFYLFTEGQCRCCSPSAAL